MGRKSLKDEVLAENLARLSITTLQRALNSDKIDLETKAKLAGNIAVKRVKSADKAGDIHILTNVSNKIEDKDYTNRIEGIKEGRVSQVLDSKEDKKSKELT